MTLIRRDRLLELDARLSSYLQVAERPGKLRTIAALFAHSGDSWFWLVGLGAVWLFTKGFWHNLAGTMALAVILMAVLVLAIKFAVRRQRPEGEWGAIYRKTDPHSFPSGHAARATLLAVLALGLGPGWFGVALAIWAPLVSLARVAMGLHYVSDVVAGSLLGLILGLIVITF